MSKASMKALPSHMDIIIIGVAHAIASVPASPTHTGW